MSPVHKPVKHTGSSSELTMITEVRHFTGKHSKGSVWLQSKATVYAARMNYSYLQLFSVLKGGIVKIDARFKISAE